MNRILEGLIRRTRLIKRRSEQVGAYPAGHYYSPIPLADDVRTYVKSRQLEGEPLGIELNEQAQHELLDEYVRFYEKQKPSLVFNGSHVHSNVALQAVQAAQWLGIPTAAFIFSWDNLTSQGRIMPPYDYYLVWNESIRSQLLDIYKEIQPEQVFVTGTPQFDFHFQQKFFWTREAFCRHVKADPARPIVLYTTGMPNHMPGEPRIVEEIANMLREMNDLGSPQLLVRVYPKDRTNRFEELKQRRPDILFPPVPWEAAWLTPRFDDTYLLTNTLRHSSVGINVASTISLELCMFDKPVINVGYNPPGSDAGMIDYLRYYKFDHYRPLVESGAGLAQISVIDRGQGMSERQLLARVELPLANPVILTGVRSGTVQIIATATLGAIFGFGGLGRYLVDGFAQFSLGGAAQMLGGVVLVVDLFAVVALVAEVRVRLGVAHDALGRNLL
jgi:hypothetical protein